MKVRNTVDEHTSYSITRSGAYKTGYGVRIQIENGTLAQAKAVSEIITALLKTDGVLSDEALMALKKLREAIPPKPPRRTRNAVQR